MSPVAVAIAGTQAVVINQDDDTVSVVDLTANTVQKTINVGHGPAAVAAEAAAKQAYVVNEADGTLSVIDLSGLTVTKTLPLGEATRGQNIALISGAGIAFITVPAAGPAGEVLVVNLASGTTTEFDANPNKTGGATGLAYFNSNLYVANQTGGSISVTPVNPATGAPTGTSTSIKVDLGARALAIDTKDNLLAVSNEGSGTIVLIDLTKNQVTGRINAVQTGGAGDSDQDDHTDRGQASNVPLVTGVSPTSGKIGSTFTLTITGMNLTGATSVVFLPPGMNDEGEGHGKMGVPQPDSTITATNLQVSAGGTQLTATVAIAASAQAGARFVEVTTPNGESISPGKMAILTVTP